jgi:hypothetical protein
MFIENSYIKFGLKNSSWNCDRWFVQPNNSTFIDLRLYVVINFNMFISSHYDLSNINLDDFPKNIIPMAPIDSWNFNYQYDMDRLENI